jgi:geranylgeranyl pyrophosphate synthase
VEDHLGRLRDTAEARVPVSAMEVQTTRLVRNTARPSSARPTDDVGTAGFDERLEWYRSLAMNAMNDAIPATGPQEYLYEPIRRFVAQPSKGLRPALCLATCLAYGGTADDAVQSAAGIELLHNAFLVHDDIEDESRFRRGQPALHRIIGIPLAVNIGDAMNALAMGLFRQNVNHLGPEPALRIFDDVDHMLRESLEGQALELGWIADDACHLVPDDYLRLVLKKTAWYSFIHPMRIGAIVADADLDTLERLHSFGFLLGAAFQVCDDLLNLAGNETLYGKEIDGDLWEGKRTLPLLHALSNATPADRAVLEHFVGRRNTGRLPRQLVEVKRILQESGSVEWTQQVATQLAGAARKQLPVAFEGAREGPDLDFVRSLTNFIVERSR